MEFEKWGCLWGRGLPPMSLYPMLLQTSVVTINAWGALLPWIQLGTVDLSGMILGVDGSGIDSEAGDMRTSTVGWAVVAISPSFEVLGGASGTVPGEQTVPRSELVAALLVALLGKGNNFTVVM